MTLEKLLQILRVGILNDRSDQTSGTSDYLWTDETLVDYINEAQRRFAVRGLVIRDGTTPEVCRVTLVADQSTYTLHESIIAVMSARVDGSVSDMHRTGHAALSVYRDPNVQWIDPYAAGSATGTPCAFSTDEGVTDVLADGFSQVRLRVYPVPTAAQAGTHVWLRVVRKPLEQLVVTNLGASPEIPEDHHMEMLDWAAYLALRIVDDDAGAARRALEFRDSFERSVAEARTLMMRKMFAPTPLAVGAHGFSWS